MKSEKQTIEYTHTTVPASMRSPYWRYFGFPADSAHNILTRQKIICTLCNAAITYNKNTSNLRTHLIARHPERLHEMHQQQQQESAGTSLDEVDVDADGEAASAAEMKPLRTLKRQHTANGNVKAEAADGPAQQKTLCNVSVATTGSGSCNALKLEQSDDLVAASAVDTEAYLACELKKSCAAVLMATNQQLVTNMPMVQHDALPLANTEATDFEYFNTTSISVAADSVADDVADETDVETLDNDSCTVDIINAELSNVNTMETHLRCKNMPDKCETTPPKATMPLLDNRNSVNSVELLAEMLTTDLLPFSTLQGRGLRQLLGHADKVDLAAVEDKVLSDYADMQQVINAHVKQITMQQIYSFSLEFYKNIEQLELVNVYINYISNDSNECNELVSVLYQTLDISDSIDFNELLKDMHLQHCGAIVTNSRAQLAVNVFANAHDIPILECVETVLTRCLDEMFKLPAIAKTLAQIRKLTAQLVDAKLPELYLPCSCSKIDYLQAIVDNMLLDKLHQVETLDMVPTLLLHINPVKITLDTIIAEPLPLCSIIRPMLVRLIEQHLWNASTEENPCWLEYRKYLTNQLKHYVNDLFVSVATFFDARFQLEPSSSVADLNILRCDIQEEICRRFERLIAQVNANEQQQRGVGRVGVASKSNLELFFDRIHCRAGDAQTNVTTTLATSTLKSTPKSGIDLEFDRYKNEPLLDLEQCPIGWWQMCAYKYKRLHRIANYYLCVPCCVTRWPQQCCNNPTIEANERLIWRQKRFALRMQSRAEICLWYLHYNRLTYDKIKKLV